MRLGRGDRCRYRNCTVGAVGVSRIEHGIADVVHELEGGILTLTCLHHHAASDRSHHLTPAAAARALAQAPAARTAADTEENGKYDRRKPSEATLAKRFGVF